MTKNLSEHGDKLDDATKSEIQTAIDDAKSVESSSDVDAIKAKSSALSNAAMKIGQAMYGKKSDESEAAPPSDNAADATYEEKDTKSK